MAKLILSSFYGLLFSAMAFTLVGESIISLGDYESYTEKILVCDRDTVNTTDNMPKETVSQNFAKLRRC